MKKRICTYDGCNRGDIRAKGYCGIHYQRLRRKGDPSITERPYGLDEVTYTTAHRRVRALHGPARDHQCADCGKQAAEWSYTFGDIQERGRVENQGARGRLLAYSPDPEQYRPLCVGCHRARDDDPVIRWLVRHLRTIHKPE